MPPSTAAALAKNPVVDVILRRRSVRSGFTDRPIPVPVLEDVVRCGLSAPSSKNARPARFHVVTDGKLLDALACDVEGSSDIENYVPFDPATGRPRPEWSSTVLESAAVLRGARAGIFVENTGAFSRGRETLIRASAQALSGSIQGYTFEMLGVGAAIQNMWIAAVSHGLSGVFMGDIVIAETAIKRRLRIPLDLVGVLALGYADQPQAPEARAEFALDSAQVQWLPAC